MLIRYSDLTFQKNIAARRAVVIPRIHLGTAAGTLFMQNGHDGYSFLNVSKVFRKYPLHLLVYHMELCGGNSPVDKISAAPIREG